MFVDPDICGIVRDKDRDVADDFDSTFVGVSLECAPLFEEEELPELACLDLFMQMLTRSFERARVARDDGALPLVPSCAVAHILHRAKERIVVEPSSRLLAEREEVATQRRVGCSLETLEGMPEQFVFVLDDGAVIHPLRWKLWRVGHVLLTEQTLFDQSVGTDEQGVPGEGGEALIRRIAVAGRPQGQHLPERLPGGGEKIYEGVGFRA